MSRFWLLALMIVCAAARADVCAVPVDEREKWLDWLLPLPKVVSFESAVVLAPGDVGVRVRRDSGNVEKTAVDEIVNLWQEKAGVAPAGGQFRIVLGICNEAGQLEGAAVPGAETLKDLPNHDQAYVIAPRGANELVLAALNEKGLYYAARTLCQLIEDHITARQVEIPIVTVKDWPDLSERGEWGGSSSRDILWLAAYKMNLVERHVSLKVTPEGKGVATTDTDQFELARRHALNVVPIITHLDQLGATGLFKVFPELEGKGPGAIVPGQEEMHAPCASDPRFQRVLADWMTSLAEQAGTDKAEPFSVCAWLSECDAKCGCDKCQAVGQYALEARCLVAAWRQARETHPNLRLRILLTQGSYSSNDKVIAECPPEVGITYYDGGRTYNSSRDPMIYPLLTDYAAQGRWLGCYPQLTASWRIVCPWSGPQFIQFRMQEFADKKLSALCGYATPDNRLYAFNILAAAEWSWNAHGRTPEQFARAWATRRGMKDPDAAAKWAVALGPVAWDVYGSGIPFPCFFGGMTDAIRARKGPDWGHGIFRYFPDRAHVEQDDQTARECTDLARRIDDPELVGESYAVRGFVQMVKAWAGMLEANAAAAGPDVPALTENWAQFAQAAMRTCRGLERWEKSANEYACTRGRFCDTIGSIKKTTRAIGAALAEMKVPDYAAEIFGAEIGRWASEEFEQNETITKTFNLPAVDSGVAAYQVEFEQGQCHNGIQIHRVALVDVAAQPNEEIAVDAHEGAAKSEVESTVYMLPADKVKPGGAYAVVCTITGVKSSDKREDLRGCDGRVYFTYSYISTTQHK